MRALITRPQEDATDLAMALRERGVEPLIEPLLKIKPIAGANIDLNGVQALLFTSVNGVRHFAALTSRRDLPAFTVGDGSARAANLAGFSHIESAGGDVNALASLVAHRLRPEDGVLFQAAGSVSAGDLAGQLEQAGFTVRRVPVYEAEPATTLSPETRMNLTLGGIDLVLLFSPRTAATFALLWRQAGSPDLERVCAICLSAAVAREVGDLPWRDVFIAERPDLPSLLALVDAELQRKDEIMADTTSQPVVSQPVVSQSAATQSAATSGSVAGDRQPSGRSTADRAPAVERASATSNASGGGRRLKAPPPPERAPASSSASAGGRGFGRVLATVLVAAVVSGAVSLTAPHWQRLLGIAGFATSNDIVFGLQQEVAQLEARHSDLAAKADIGEALAPLQDDVAKLKATIAQLTQSSAPPGGQAAAGGTTVASVDLTPLNDKVAALESSLSDLQAKIKSASEVSGASTSGAPAAGSSASPQPLSSALSLDMSALKAENQALRDQITTLSSKLDSLGKNDLGNVAQRVAVLEAQIAAAPAPVTAKQQLATAIVLAVGQLQNRLAGTQGFGGDLTTLKQLAGSDAKLAGELDPVLEKLAPVAMSGAPTLSQLQASLPATEIARAAEAEEASSLAQDAGWWRRMTHRLAEIITVRPVGEDVAGNGPLERLARAEAVLKKGDLAKAVDELSGLTGEPAKRAATWLAQAKARLTLDWASTQLGEIAIRQLASSASSDN